ncbi:MAG TPA: phenylalanine--tRNA ligase subunit alpha [Bdellovibrionota bacterium]|nr:phenylalanine--tRNA ligase subunit alpha [Bdellovibrionota bacterium]
MKDSLVKLEQEFDRALAQASSLEGLEQLRVSVFGKKGTLTQALREVGTLPQEERRKAGERINLLRQKLESQLSDRKQKLEEKSETEAIRQERIDVTLPGRKPLQGKLHPLSLVEDRIVKIFRSLGFSVESGPEIETDYYNFEALNIPADHPARDMQDTFFVEGGLLLRTHTSPVQIRTMETSAPPIRIVVPGRAFRRDSDATHSPVFHQVEGLCVGPDVSFAHLKGTLEAFVHMMFGPEIGTRFRPSFFPFTEPSAEVDMACGNCRGKGCRLCKGTGWLEILGCGMVDPNVYQFVGNAWKSRNEEIPYDPEKISGFAFGMGIERVAMVLFGIDNIRILYENDTRFLEQFAGAL